MTKRKLLLITGTLSLIGFKSQAQDAHFSHFNNSQWYFNPAMANNDSLDHVSIKHRNQWPALSANYVTNVVNYTHYFSKSNGAIYGAYINDQAGGGVLNTNSFHVGYAQKFKLGDALMLQLGGEVAYGVRTIDWSKLSTTGKGGRGDFFDVSSGVVLSGKGLYAGVSLHHINQPNVSAIEGNSPLPQKIGAQLGYSLKITEDLGVDLNGFYYAQSGFNSLIFGGDLNLKRKYFLGYYFRSRDAHVFKAGVNMKRINMFYSYDMTQSKLSNVYGASHELSMAYKFWKKSGHKDFMNW